MKKKHIFPQFCTSVTVYRKVLKTGADGKTAVFYKREVYDGCYWGLKEDKEFSKTAMEDKNVYICRLPLCDIRPGDVLFKGVVRSVIEDKAGKRMSDLIERKKPDCFTATLVRKNSAVSYLAHTRVEGV